MLQSFLKLLKAGQSNLFHVGATESQMCEREPTNNEFAYIDVMLGTTSTLFQSGRARVWFLIIWYFEYSSAKNVFCNKYGYKRGRKTQKYCTDWKQ